MTSTVTSWLTRMADRYPAAVRPVRKPLLALRHRFARPRVELTQQLLERLASLVVEDVCVSVAEFDGRFYIDPRSALFRRLISNGDYEPLLSQICRDQLNPARDVLDIGANVGFHAVLFGQLLREGRVLSVEPTSRALARLKRNVELNGVQERVLVHHGAVSNEAGMIDIKTIEGQEEFSSAGALTHPAIRGVAYKTETVSAHTVDELVQQYELDAGFIKADVEGLEHLVFEGASEVLAKHRPVILAELSDPLLRENGSSAMAVVERLSSFDYQIQDPLRPDAQPGTREFGDILCLPR